MFNAEIKNQYLDEMEYRNTNLRIYLTCQFEKSAEMESKLGKDISNFTIEEIIDYYKSLCLTSFETLMVLTSQFKIYTDWCLNRTLVKDNQNHFYEMVYEVIVNCVNSGLAFERIVSREDLLHMIKDLNNPSDQFLVLAMFEGICGKRMCELTTLNINDFEGNEVHLNTGRVLKVSDELVKLAQKATDEFTYYTYSINGDIKELYYKDNDYNIFKKMYNASDDGDIRQRLYNKLMRIKKLLNAECCTSTALNESGRIYEVKKLAKEMNLPFKECLIKVKGLEDRYGKIYSYSTYMLKYGDIIEGM